MLKYLFIALPFLLIAREVPVISSWTEPTLEDISSLQEHLEELADYDFARFEGKISKGRLRKVNTFNILAEGEIPEKKLELFRTTEEDLSCVIVAYASYGGRYIESMDQLKRGLQYVGYKGHFLYWIGGWPYVEGGGLELFDTPYAFKVCALMEAYAMGYKKVLWLDSRMCPMRNLKPLFAHLETEPVVMRKSQNQSLDRLGKEWVLEALGTTTEELKGTVHYATGVLGLNLEDPRAVALLEAYYETAKNRDGFISSFPCQLPWSLVVGRSDLNVRLKGPLVRFPKQKSSDAFFFCDYFSTFQYPEK